jgi:hypothetical protein
LDFDDKAFNGAEVRSTYPFVPAIQVQSGAVWPLDDVADRRYPLMRLPATGDNALAHENGLAGRSPSGAKSGCYAGGWSHRAQRAYGLALSVVKPFIASQRRSVIRQLA